MRESGFINLIYMGAIAIFAVLILVGSYGRFLSAVKSKSYLSDRLSEEYRAESEINNYLSQYYQGNLDSDDLGLPKKEKLDGATLDIISTDQGQGKVIEVLLKKGIVSTRYNLYYPNFLTEQSPTKLIIGLDCTNSQLRDFQLPLDNGGVSLSVVAFGEKAVWLEPQDGVYNCSLVADQIGETSSPGTGMIFMNNQLKNFDGNKVAILVIAGEPESVKQTFGSTCLEDEDCTICKQKALDFFSCSIADNNTKWNRYDKGNRNPSVQLHTVYVNQDTPNSDLNESLRKYPNQSIFIGSNTQLVQSLQKIIYNSGKYSYRATIEKVVE